MWGVVFFNVDDVIFHRRTGASQDSDCFHLGVCQVTGVKVAGCHIGLELLTPIEIATRCDAWIEEPAPRFSIRNVAIRLPNLCLIVSVTDSDTWVGVFFDLPSARVFDGWLEVRALRQVSVHKKVRCERYILESDSGAFRDYLRSLLSGATGDYTGQSLSSFSALSVNPLGLPSGASKAKGNIKICSRIYRRSLLTFPSLTAVSVSSEVPWGRVRCLD